VKRRSMTLRLSMLVALTTLVMAGGAGAWSYAQALQSARDLQDDVLTKVATLVAATTTKGGIPPDEFPLSNDAADIDVTSLEKAGLPPATAIGLGTAQIRGESRRIFVIRNGKGTELVVSQSIEVRDETARESAISTVTPLLLLVPALLLAIFLVVRSVMRPVNRLAEEVRSRNADDLSPLAEEAAPAELQAFLAALNTQFGRVAASLDRERLFVAEAAHELRTPLTAMSLQLERAAIAPDSARLRERLGELGRGVGRSRHLIDQLLELARAQGAAKDAHAPERLDVLVRDVVSDLLPLADEAGVELEVNVDDVGTEPLPVAATTSVLRNLVDNAIRYSSAGGQVQLSARRDGALLVIVVDDDGPGIAHPDDVLRPFARGEHQDVQGSGLGLAIVKEQVRRLRGTFELGQSERFVTGTRAVVRLPIDTAPTSTPSTSVAQVRVDSRSGKPASR
jgi:two-component system OmpR family sensor kinase